MKRADLSPVNKFQDLSLMQEKVEHKIIESTHNEGWTRSTGNEYFGHHEDGTKNFASVNPQKNEIESIGLEFGKDEKSTEKSSSAESELKGRGE